jgi:hypothetical protein
MHRRTRGYLIVVANERTRESNYGTRYNRSYMYFVNSCVVEKKKYWVKNNWGGLGFRMRIAE